MQSISCSIRKEKPEDYFAADLAQKKAFWNLRRPGCSEHYLVHKIRRDPAYVPELTRIAEKDGEIIGGIWYVRALLASEAENREILTFGPLGVVPKYQNCGVGGALLEETMELAEETGFQAIVIFGEPGYYPKHGFFTCDRFGVTTEDGKNFDAFMGIELVPGALRGTGGRFLEPKVYGDLPQDEVDEFDKKFPYMPKLKLPGQWD